MSEEKKDHVHVHPVRPRGTSAHTKEELEQDMNAGALEQGTFHLTNLKGSTAGIVSPEELSGSNYDQTFLQGVDVKTYEQATSYLTAKVRTNNHFNVIRSNKLGERDAGVTEGTSPYAQHRSLTLDEPEYFDDNTSPGSAGAGSKAQLDTSSNRRKPFIHNKHYRERRDLGQHDIFTGGDAYKDTTTVDPTLIVGQETGFGRNNIEFPPYMIHASDRISSDGTIEAYPIRSAADRSNLQHPHTARGIKSDLNLVDAYRKSDVIKDQTEKLGTRQLIIGRNVDSSTSIICNVSNAGDNDTLTFTIRGITCSIRLKENQGDVSEDGVNAEGTLDGTPIDIHVGDSDKKLAENLSDALTRFRFLGVRIAVARTANVVFLREALDRVRTKGVRISATNSDSSEQDKNDITSAHTCGAFTIEFHKYPDLLYESSKTRALSGYDYYLDGVESFGIEVLNDAERVKLLTSSIPNPDSEDPDDRIRVDAYIPWLIDERSGTYGESHVGPINTQGFIAPEHTHISFFEDDSDMDALGRKLSDDNTFASKPNFFLTDARTTITGRRYTENENLLVQSSWIHSATPFVTSSHYLFGQDDSLYEKDKDKVHQLSSQKTFAKSLILFSTTQPEAESLIAVKDTLGSEFVYSLGTNTNIESSVTLEGEEYGNKITPSSNSNATVQMRGTQARVTHSAMPEPGSTITMTLPSLGTERDHFQMIPGNTYVITNNPGLSTSFTSAGAAANSVGTSFVATNTSGTGGSAKVTEVISLTKTYVYKIDGTTGELDGDRVVVIREGTTAKAIENLEVAFSGESGHNSAVIMPTSRSGSTLTIPGLLYSRKLTASAFRDSVQKNQGNSILAEMENQNQVRLSQRIVEFQKLGNHDVLEGAPNPVMMVDMTPGEGPTRSGTFTPSTTSSTLVYLGDPAPTIGQELVPQAGGILDFFRLVHSSNRIIIGQSSEWDDIIGSDTASGSTQKMTFSAWIYKEDHGDNNESNVLDFNGDVTLKTNINNQVLFYARWNGSTTHWYTKSSDAFSLSEWVHIAVTYDANSASSVPKIYINGQEKALIAGGTPSGDFDGISGGSCVIGNSATQARQFKGKIAAVYIANDVLNGVQIKSIMASNSYNSLMLGGNSFTTIEGFTGGFAKALANTGVTGSVSFNKESPYFPESNHYGVKSSQGVRDTYPAVSVISGSHHFSGRKGNEVTGGNFVVGHQYVISAVATSNWTGWNGPNDAKVGDVFTADAAGSNAGNRAFSLKDPKFANDAPWSVSYWMSGSDERADHFRSVRDVLHFRDTTGNGSYDTKDHYPNVPNFSVRHFMRRNYGFLYVSLYDNDFYPNNHHRVDFIFAGVKEGVNTTFLRNSPEENALYNAITGEDSWNHFAISYDGGMHSTLKDTSDPYSDYTYRAGNVTHGTKNTPANNSYKNFLEALENESRHGSDTITYGPNIFLQSSADSLVAGKKYVIINAGTYTADHFDTIASSFGGSGSDPKSNAVGTIFTASGAANPSGQTATVRAKSEKYLEDSITQTSVTAGSFVKGNRYTITSVGSTDFTLVGAPSNTVGVSFFATGPGAGNGSANTSSSTRTLLYNYGVNSYEPYVITGSIGGGKLACPVRLHLNGVDITDASLEYITHNSVRTSGYSDRYGKDYTSGGGVGASATLTYTGLPADGNTLTLVSADNTSKTYEFDNDGSVTGTNTKILMQGEQRAINPSSTFNSAYFKQLEEASYRVNFVQGTNSDKTVDGSTVAAADFDYLRINVHQNFPSGNLWAALLANRPLMPGEQLVVSGYFFNGQDPEVLADNNKSLAPIVIVYETDPANLTSGDGFMHHPQFAEKLIPEHFSNAEAVGQGIVPAFNEGGSNGVYTTEGWKYNTTGRSAATTIQARNRTDSANQLDATLHTLLLSTGGDPANLADYTVEQVTDAFTSRFYSITIKNDTSNPAYFKLLAWDVTGDTNPSADQFGVHDLRFNYSGTVDTQYALLAHVVSNDIYNGTNHYNKITSTHSALNNTVKFTQNVVGGTGNKTVTSNIANATIPSSFSGGIDPNLDFRDIKFTGEEYTLTQANAASVDGAKAFSGHTVMSSSIVFGGDPNATSFRTKLLRNSTYFPTATISYTGQPSAGDNITLISTDTTSKQYVFVLGSDTKSGGGALGTGDELAVGDQVGGVALESEDSKIDGIAVEIHGLTADQTYASLKSAIDGETGHNAGSAERLVVVSSNDGNNAGNFLLTQTSESSIGNTTIVSSITNASVPESFVSSSPTLIRRRVHANQNTNTIAEFAMWSKEMSGDQIKAVWELSRYNDVLFTVQKPMAEALSRMRSSFEDGVDKGHRHTTKGFVFGDSEHGTDSIVYGGLKK